MLPSPVLPARRLRRTLSPLIGRAARRSGADRYRKSFPARAHVWMLLLHAMGAMGANGSLRQSHALQGSDPSLRRFVGMEGWVSYSQLARSSTSRPSECFELVLASLLRRARGRSGRRVPEILRGVELVDSSFFALGKKASPWSAHGAHGAGVRLQALLDPTDRLPEAMRMTTVSSNDAAMLGDWDLSRLGGRTLVFDLGYYSHRNLQRLRDGGVRFLTRLKGQAHYRATERGPLAEGEAEREPQKTPEGDTVLSDETITLGSPNNRLGAVLEGVRLVTGKNAKGEVHRFVTDRFDLAAGEVLSLYRKRWQIELFFRWLKRQLGALRPLGHSREAVWLTLVVAAIVAVVATLAEEHRPKGVTRVSWLGALSVSLSRPPHPDGYD